MNRLLSVVLMSFVVLAPCAYADSILNINITYVTASMGPSDVSFTLIGPGTTIAGYGGIDCQPWCSGPIPDLNSVGISNFNQVFVSFYTSAIVGGTTYDPNDTSLCCFSGDFSGSVSGSVGSGETFKLVNLTLPGGGWNLNFAFFPASGGSPAYYQFVYGTFTAGTPPAATPEPGTLGLMATGLAGIIGVIQRGRLIRC
jgi:hypothetical protein